MDNFSLYTDKELFVLIASGAEKAFETLFHRWKHRVFTIAKMHTENDFRSEEIVQDIFLKIWNSRATLAAIEVPEAWIYRITRNYALNVLKQMARDPAFAAQDSLTYIAVHHGGESPFQERELDVLLQEGLNLLTPQQKTVFELSRLEKKSREEVAAVMGISKATVSVHLTIALRVLRAFFNTRLDMLRFILLFGYLF